MSEEIKGKNTTPETEVNQNTPEVEDKEELIASDSLDKMMEELKEEADGKPQSDLQEAEKTGSTAVSYTHLDVNKRQPYSRQNQRYAE